MTYAPTVKVTPNPVDKMFGFVRANQAMQAMREALREADRALAADFRSGPLRDKVIALAKGAGQASRPTVAPQRTRGKSLGND